MAITFPSNPSIGDEYTAGGFTWIWDGTSWSKAAAATGGVANDFALLVGTTGNTTYVLDRTYSAGSYAIDFANNDTTYDIYFIAEDGTYAGYTNGVLAEVSADFAEVVVLGAANNETILFNYQGSLTSPSTVGDVAVAGAYITSVVTSSLPNIDDTTVVNGGNFAADVAVSFIGQNATETAAKTVVRSSSTQLVITRPDSFTPDQSPYTVKVVNPGIPVPAGSNAHLLSNSVTAGTNPSWVTPTTIAYNIGGTTSITLLATDTEGSDIDYTLVGGTLPDGLTLDGETGVISGTATVAVAEGTVTSITVRATDTGGNFLDRTFSLTANTAPTWTTAAGALTGAALDSAYSFQLVASTGTAGGTLTYSLQSGSLPTGLSLSSTGLISGTPTISAENPSFTVRVTDEGGLFADRTFSILVSGQQFLMLSGVPNVWDEPIAYSEPLIDSNGDIYYATQYDGSVYVIQKRSATGDLIWKKQWTGSNASGRPMSIHELDSTKIVVGGTHNSTVVTNVILQKSDGALVDRRSLVLLANIDTYQGYNAPIPGSPGEFVQTFVNGNWAFNISRNNVNNWTTIWQKYSDQGTQLYWVKPIEPISGGRIFTIQQNAGSVGPIWSRFDYSGNYQAYRHTTFPSTSGIASAATYSNSDFIYVASDKQDGTLWLHQMNFAGTTYWSKEMYRSPSSSYPIYGVKIAVDQSDGSFYVATWGPSNTGTTGNDLYIVKLDVNANIIWQRSIVASFAQDSTVNLRISPTNGDIYIFTRAQTSNDSLTYQPFIIRMKADGSTLGSGTLNGVTFTVGVNTTIQVGNQSVTFASTQHDVYNRTPQGFQGAGNNVPNITDHTTSYTTDKFNI